MVKLLPQCEINAFAYGETSSECSIVRRGSSEKQPVNTFWTMALWKDLQIESGRNRATKA